MSKRRSLFLPQDDGKPILFDYYDGAYGKTLRIDVQSPESMEGFSRFLEGLSNGAISQTSVRSIEQAVLVPPLLDVRLVRSGNEGIMAKGEAKGTVIEWNNQQNGWQRIIGLLGPLVAYGRQGKSGHQYLTAPDASILVELALLE